MSEPVFELRLETQPAKRTARLTLTAEGRQLPTHEVRLDDHRPALWEGLFDTRSYVGRYAGSTVVTDHPATADDLLALLGLFLGEEVLGRDATAALAEALSSRTRS